MIGEFGVRDDDNDGIVIIEEEGKFCPDLGCPLHVMDFLSRHDHPCGAVWGHELLVCMQVFQGTKSTQSLEWISVWNKEINLYYLLTRPR